MLWQVVRFLFFFFCLTVLRALLDSNPSRRSGRRIMAGECLFLLMVMALAGFVTGYYTHFLPLVEGHSFQRDYSNPASFCGTHRVKIIFGSGGG